MSSAQSEGWDLFDGRSNKSSVLQRTLEACLQFFDVDVVFTQGVANLAGCKS